MPKVMKSALEAIGNTPLIALNRVFGGPGRLLAKAEYLNPGGSIKDRVARRIILEARKQGQLRPGQPVIEMTSGNMGAGLAVVCGILGHPFTAVISEGVSPERGAYLEYLGASVIRVPQVNGSPGHLTQADINWATGEARLIAENTRGFFVDQFQHMGAIRAHMAGTGPEIWHGCEGEIDAFVAGVGTGATLTGVGRFLKSKKEALNLFAVEPEGAEILAGKESRKVQHRLEGIGYGTIPPHFDATLVEGFIPISDEEALEMADYLRRREGLDVGNSSAANVAAALALLRSDILPQGATVVTVLCDRRR